MHLEQKTSRRNYLPERDWAASVKPPRVFVFTDINIDSGDPDDRQSLVHLLWYTDELEVTGIVPDRWDARGAEACHLALDAYSIDFERHRFFSRGYPQPQLLRERIAPNLPTALEQFQQALEASDRPLHVLVWGNLVNVEATLRRLPDSLMNRVRLITIGSGVLRPLDRPHLPPGWKRHEPCKQPNWNGDGRAALVSNARFDRLWWLEMNWTYGGMFLGDEPKAMLLRLAEYGALGQHMVDVTANHPWARYFRVVDTPSVLYLLDPDNSLDDPTHGSWAGHFVRPMPVERPYYFADDPGDVPWNHADPCDTWENAEAVAAYAQSTLHERRPSMYAALLMKLAELYQGPDGGGEK